MFTNNPGGPYNTPTPFQQQPYGNTYGTMVGSAPSAPLGMSYNQPYGGANMNPTSQLYSQQAIYQQEVNSMLRGFDHVLTAEFPKQHKALIQTRDAAKEQTTKYLKDIQERSDKIKASDSSRFEKVSKQCREIQERNDEIRRELLRVQDDVVRTASNIGRVNRQPDWEAELYRRVSELKRVLAEADKRLYEIQMVGRPQVREQSTTEKPLKELEHAIQILAVQASKKRLECDTLVKIMRS